MKPGTMVAFILNAEIRFGIIAAVIRRETKDAETKQFNVTVGADDGGTREVTVANEDDMIDASGWNASDQLHALARRLPSYAWAQKKIEEEEAAASALASAEPDPAPPEAVKLAPAATDDKF